MEPLKTVHGRAIPLDRADVDTDQIIPAKYLKRIERTGYGQFAFETWREKDPDFVLNRPEYEGAPVMITGPNFGCGSSREHAPWAIEDIGVKAIIAPSFADIFRNNCAKIGLLTVTLDQADVDYLIRRHERHPDATLTVDLESQTVRTDDGEFERHFEIEPFVKHNLLNGLDGIGLTLQHADDIGSYEKHRVSFKPNTELFAETVK